VRANVRNVLAELYLAGAVIISLVLAAILAQIPAVAFGGFFIMAAVLIAADLVLYILMKLGVLKAPRDNRST